MWGGKTSCEKLLRAGFPGEHAIGWERSPGRQPRQVTGCKATASEEAAEETLLNLEPSFFAASKAESMAMHLRKGLLCPREIPHNGTPKIPL